MAAGRLRRRARTTMAELGLYVYGLVADGELARAPALPGIEDEHGVQCLCQAGVCALVSRVSLEQFEEQPLREHLADMRWIEQTARRHQQVLDAVIEQCTPLPMRLCTLYSDEDGLRRMLDRRQHDLSAALSELRGKLEWGVQIFAAPERAAAKASPPSGNASGTSYLQQKLAARRAAQQADAGLDAICERLHGELCAVALACRLGAPQRAEVSRRQMPMIMNGFYLVPNQQRERFCRRAGELHDEVAEQGLALQLTGPWPPYNFVTAVVGEER